MLAHNEGSQKHDITEINQPSPTLATRQYAILSTLSADAGAAGKASHGGAALDLAGTARRTCLIDFMAAVPGC